MPIKWIEEKRKKLEAFQGLPFPANDVQPGLDMSVKRIMELYGMGCPVAVAHQGDYDDDISDTDADFDFYQPEDEFEVQDYLRENSPEKVRERHRRKKEAEKASESTPQEKLSEKGSKEPEPKETN